MLKIITYSPKESIDFAEKIGAMLKKGDIIAYKGGMGAGKTTFTRGLAKGLGLISDDVTSPTFAIVNEYIGDKISLYHFDMYRISGGMDLESTGFYDYPLEDNVFAVEWSENIENELPEKLIKITINRIDDETREIIIEGDERFC